MDSQIFQRAMETGGRLTVKSALNPILWLCALISIPTISANVFWTLPVWISIIGCSPIIMAMFGFMFLLFFDRDKLQSEDFQLKKRSLELVEQKGDITPRLITNEEVTSNPDLPSISSQNNDMSDSSCSIKNVEEE
ncbi:hypothetical protein ACDX34_21765 [Acinetobacter bereziniae]|uniref:hypothetical protein n=1 Tax=Acinetobacter bereziniae TaxID=106648 RepID=UPI0039C40386